MVKILIAIGILFLIGAFSILGSPLFALLLVVPAILLYIGWAGIRNEVGGRSERMERMRPDQSLGSRPGDPTIAQESRNPVE